MNEVATTGMQAYFTEGLHRLCLHRDRRRSFEQKRAQVSAFLLPTADYGCTKEVAWTSLLFSKLSVCPNTTLERGWNSHLTIFGIASTL
jgi:hypothetical protein